MPPKEVSRTPTRDYSRVAVPPAASIFSFADAEKRCAVTLTATEISPVPRT
jgi:hypothetical protein